MKLLFASCIAYLLVLGSLRAQYFSTIFNLNPSQQSGWGVTADTSEIFVAVGSVCNPGFRLCSGLAKFTSQGEFVWFDSIGGGFSVSGRGIHIQHPHVFMTILNSTSGERYLSKFDRSTGALVDNGPDYSSYYYLEYWHGYVKGTHTGYVPSWVRINESDGIDHYRILFIDPQTRVIRRELLVPIVEGYHNVASSGLLELSDGTLLGVGPACGASSLCGVVTRFDTLGNILWRTYLNQSAWVNEFSLPRAVNLPDDRIGVLWRVSPLNLPGDYAHYIFYTMDTLGNILHEQAYPDIDEVEKRQVNNMFPAANGDAFLVGTYYDFTGITESREYGYLARLGPLGEVRWERKILDERFTLLAESKYFVDLEELPNGDLVVVGEMDVRLGTGRDPAVWLLRLDSMGCLSPNCGEWQVITDTQEPAVPDVAQLQVWPNPATGQCHLKLPVGPHWVALTLHDALGQVLRQQPIASGDSQPQLSLLGLPPGIYTTTVTAADGQQVVGRLVVQ